eukprot:UN13728
MRVSFKVLGLATIFQRNSTFSASTVELPSGLVSWEYVDAGIEKKT